jgi:hypothetical protein
MVGIQKTLGNCQNYQELAASQASWNVSDRPCASPLLSFHFARHVCLVVLPVFRFLRLHYQENAKNIAREPTICVSFARGCPMGLRNETT